MEAQKGKWIHNCSQDWSKPLPLPHPTSWPQMAMARQAMLTSALEMAFPNPGGPWSLGVLGWGGESAGAPLHPRNHETDVK